jgi:hypothetical protein
VLLSLQSVGLRNRSVLSVDHSTAVIDGERACGHDQQHASDHGATAQQLGVSSRRPPVVDD